MKQNELSDGTVQSQILAPQEKTAHQPSVRIVSLETSVPPFYVKQTDAYAYLVRNFPEFSEMAGVFANSNIEGRYSSVPTSWYNEKKGWAESNRTYIENALVLLQEAATKALHSANLLAAEVDAVVMVSSTGFAMPSLDAQLAENLNFKPDLERTPIVGLGCAGGVSGLARAGKLARSSPGCNVLLLVMELGGLNSRMAAESGAFLVSSALFGDGAAAAIIRAGAEVEAAAGHPTIGASGEHRCKGTLGLMGWTIADTGFEVVLSGKVPAIIRQEFQSMTMGFLKRNGLSIDDMKGILVHPGGPKVLDAVQDALDLDRHALDLSRDIMCQYGNMSSPTVLFILKQALENGARGLHLLAAPGPGLTISYAVVDL